MSRRILTTTGHNCMISIKDVAQKAGVSATTVSHVINSTRFVAPNTKEKVEKAISELGYQPSSLARALKVNSTRTLGMLVTSSSNPFFAEVVAGVEETCFRNGYSLILCNSLDKNDRLIAHLQALMQKRIDALLIMTTTTDKAFYETLRNFDSLPKVFLDSEVEIDGCAIVDDSVRGGYKATSLLIKRGLRRIGCLLGPEGHPRSRERYQGFGKAMDEAGLAINPDWIIADDLSAEGGHRAMCKQLALRDFPEAIFACNDLMAIGAYRAIYERGLSVPDDISIVGYDDLELAAYMTPSLTTIYHPSFDLGVTAAENLINHLEHKADMPSTIQLAPKLILRESVRPEAS